MENNILTIGTIVKLKDAEDKFVMIIGRGRIVEDNNKKIMYDYIGCMYPEGVLSSNYTLYFNKEDISEVVFAGFKNELEDAYIENYKKMVKLIVENDLLMQKLGDQNVS